MLAQLIDRRRVKEEARETLESAQVSPKAFTALYFALVLVLDLVDSFTGEGVLSVFVSVLALLMTAVLRAGYQLYIMAVWRGERAEYLTVFDGFSFAGKVVALYLLESLFVFLWSLLFTIPGIVALYRYRFAVWNLCENPDLSPLEALNMSKRQTLGYKSQLFGLDLSYLGWTVLSMLPLLVYNTILTYDAMSAAASYYGLEAAAMPMDLTAILPLWGWTLVIGVWSLAVSVFYMPGYLCAEMTYFDIAKRTSGVGTAQRPLSISSPEEPGEDDEPFDMDF